MTPALCLSDLPLPFGAAVRLAVDSGFAHVVVAAWEDRSPDDYEVLADTGVVVAGAVLGHLPPGCVLDVADINRRRRAVEALKRQIADAARLGSQFVLLAPGSNRTAEGGRWFLEACGLLAEYASGRMVRLCLSHQIDSALPTPEAALGCLEKLTAPSGLVLDVAACLAAGAHPAAWVIRGESRLGCLRMTASPSCRAELEEVRQAGFDGLVVLTPLQVSADAVARLREWFG
jgi:sugar phosphate isomerase/epimerase